MKYKILDQQCVNYYILSLNLTSTFPYVFSDCLLSDTKMMSLQLCKVTGDFVCSHPCPFVLNLYLIEPLLRKFTCLFQAQKKNILDSYVAIVIVHLVRTYLVEFSTVVNCLCNDRNLQELP